MAPSWIKLKVVFCEDIPSVNFTDLLPVMRDKYPLVFSSLRLYNGCQIFYFQSTVCSKMNMNTVCKICSTFGNVKGVSTFKNDFEGDLLLTFGTFKKHGGSRKVKNVSTVNNIDNSVNDNSINFTINMHINDIGTESLDHITFEDMVRLAQEKKNDNSRYEVDSFLVFAKKLYEQNKNVNVKAARKEGSFLAYVDEEWASFPMKTFAPSMSNLWFAAFRDCIEERNVGIDDSDLEEMFYELGLIRTSIREQDKEFYKIIKERGLEIFENIQLKKREEKRNNKRKRINK